MLGLETRIELGWQSHPLAFSASRQALNVYKITGGQTRSRPEDPILNGGFHNLTDPTEPGPGLADHKITVEGPLCVNQFPWWLMAFFGPPSTSGGAPNYVHDFASGGPLAVISVQHELQADDFRRHVGCVGEELKIALDPGADGFGRFSMTFLGIEEQRDTVTAGGTITAPPPLNRPAEAMASVLWNAVAGGQIIGGDLTFKRKLRRIRAADGSSAPRGVEYDGKSTLGGSLKLRYANQSIIADAWSRTERSMALELLRSPSRGFRARCGHALLDETPIGADGADGVEVDIPLMAYQSPDDPALILTALSGQADLSGPGGSEDTTPDAFAFTDVTNAALSTVITSNTVTVAGITATTSVTVSGGTWSKNGGGFTGSAGTVEAGDTVAVRASSSGSNATAVNVVLTIGGVSDVFTITTASLASDTTPDIFTFTDVTGAALSTVYTAAPITVSGINAATAASVSGGTWSKNGGAYSAASGTVANGDVVRVRVTSASSNSAAVNVVLTIGGVSDTYTVTTAAVASDTTPDAFAFTDLTGAAVSTVYESDTITVAGINAPANLTISGGQYSVNGGAYASAPRTVVNGEAVRVRATSAASAATAVNVVLTIGGVADTYTVTTAAGGGGVVVTIDDSPVYQNGDNYVFRARRTGSLASAHTHAFNVGPGSNGVPSVSSDFGGAFPTISATFAAGSATTTLTVTGNAAVQPD